jgi:hypothetical protein
MPRQVQQTTACNALHSVEARTCKWLVRMYDLAGNDLPLTQGFLAQMMGVQRTRVSGVAIRLQDEGSSNIIGGRCAFSISTLYKAEPASATKLCGNIIWLCSAKSR